MQDDRLDLTTLPPGWRARLDWFLASQGQGFNARFILRARLHDVAALEALSDAELLSMGLKRRDIPAFVFADLLGPHDPIPQSDA